MKPGKSSSLFLIIGLLVIILAGLSMVYSQQADKRMQLEEQLSQASKRLSSIQLESIRSRKEQLEKQLGQITVQLQTTQATLSTSSSSITATTTLLDAAEASNVSITELSSSGPTTENLGGVSVPALPIDVKVEGALPDLLNFIFELNKGLPTSLVKTIELSASGPAQSPAGGESTIYPEVSRASASIRIVIYALNGE